MSRVAAWLILFVAILIITIMVTHDYSQAQLNPQLQEGFSPAIVAINNAEAAGATSNETAPLVALLNKALELNREASALPGNQSELRNVLISTVNQILTKVTNQANTLANASAQRTYTNKILTYITGIGVAVVGTFVCLFGVEFYQRYRIKRTFQMRIRRK